MIHERLQQYSTSIVEVANVTRRLLGLMPLPRNDRSTALSKAVDVELCIQALGDACAFLAVRGDSCAGDARLVQRLFTSFAANGYLVGFTFGGIYKEPFPSWLVNEKGEMWCFVDPPHSSKPCETAWELYTFRDSVDSSAAAAGAGAGPRKCRTRRLSEGEADHLSLHDSYRNSASAGTGASTYASWGGSAAGKASEGSEGKAGHVPVLSGWHDCYRNSARAGTGAPVYALWSGPAAPTGAIESTGDGADDGADDDHDERA
jgi:hypothetical protein